MKEAWEPSLPAACEEPARRQCLQGRGDFGQTWSPLEISLGILISGTVNNQCVFVEYFTEDNEAFLTSPPRRAIWVIFCVLHFIDCSVVSMAHGRLLMWQCGSSPPSSGSSIQAILTEGSGSFLSWGRCLLVSQDLGKCEAQGLQVAPDAEIGRR